MTVGVILKRQCLSRLEFTRGRWARTNITESATSSTRMERSTEDTSRTAEDREQESDYFLQKPYTEVTGMLISPMEMAYSSLATERSLRPGLIMERSSQATREWRFFWITVITTKVRFSTTGDMDMESAGTPMEIFTRASGTKTSVLVVVNWDN